MGIQNATGLVYFDRFGRIQIPEFSSYIQVIYNNEQKDIFVAVTNLLTRNNIGINGAIVYETNVTDIPNIDILFNLLLYEDYEDGVSCRFIKGEKKANAICLYFSFFQI